MVDRPLPSPGYLALPRNTALGRLEAFATPTAGIFLTLLCHLVRHHKALGRSKSGATNRDHMRGRRKQGSDPAPP